jgi:hypothetical protein
MAIMARDSGYKDIIIAKRSQPAVFLCSHNRRSRFRVLYFQTLLELAS